MQKKGGAVRRGAAYLPVTDPLKEDLLTELRRTPMTIHSSNHPTGSFALRAATIACMAALLFSGTTGCASDDGAAGEAQSSDTADAPAAAQGRAAETAPLDSSVAVALDSTTALAESGLPSVAPGAALPLIETWQEALRDADNPAMTAIASDLEELKEEMQAQSIDGVAVREILVRLGNKTSAAAESADSTVARRLERLGTLLREAGARGGN